MAADAEAAAAAARFADAFSPSIDTIVLVEKDYQKGLQFAVLYAEAILAACGTSKHDVRSPFLAMILCLHNNEKWQTEEGRNLRKQAVELSYADRDSAEFLTKANAVLSTLRTALGMTQEVEADCCFDAAAIMFYSRKEYRLAFELANAAIQKGNWQAYMILIAMYKHGLGVEASEAKCAECKEKMKAAMLADAQSSVH